MERIWIPLEAEHMVNDHEYGVCYAQRVYDQNTYDLGTVFTLAVYGGICGVLEVDSHKHGRSWMFREDADKPERGYYLVTAVNGDRQFYKLCDVETDAAAAVRGDMLWKSVIPPERAEMTEYSVVFALSAKDGTVYPIHIIADYLNYNPDTATYYMFPYALDEMIDREARRWREERCLWEKQDIYDVVRSYFCTPGGAARYGAFTCVDHRYEYDRVTLQDLTDYIYDEI